MNKADIEQAMLDPAAAFEAPVEIAHHPTLSRDNKIRLLRSWHQQLNGRASDSPADVRGEINQVLGQLSA